MYIDEKKLTEEQIKQIEEWTKPTWKPCYGEIYYYIDCAGNVCGAHWYDTKVDEFNWAVGNCYSTIEEAEFALEKMKVVTDLKRFAEVHNEPIDWADVHQYKWCMCYDCYEEKIVKSCWSAVKHNDIYFSSEELCEQAIKEIGEERIKKYYLEVEE